MRRKAIMLHVLKNIFPLLILLYSFNFTLCLSEEITLANQNSLFNDKLSELPERLKRSIFKVDKQEAIIKKLLASKGSNESKAIIEWILSFHFQDRHEILLENIKSIKPYPVPSAKYEKKGEYPFDGYLAARAEIFLTPIERLSISEIHKTHKMLLSKESINKDRQGPKINSENINDEDLGKFRNHTVDYLPRRITSENDSLILTSGKVLKKIDSIGKLTNLNPYLTLVKFDNGDKSIYYLHPSTWQKEEIKSRLSPSLNKRIDDFASINSLDLIITQFHPDIEKFHEEILAEMVESFLKDLKQKLKSCKTKRDVINAVAKFHHSFISIHPYSDGNGRLVRLLTERFLNEYNIPSPIWVYHDEDVELTYEQFRDLMVDSINLSDQFYDQIKKFNEAGTDLDLVTIPFFYNQSDFDKIKDEAGIKGKINQEEFMTWVYNGYGKDYPDLKTALVDFEKWKHKFLNKDAKDSDDGIILAPPSFISSYNKLSTTEEEYKRKLSFYKENEFVYRGVGAEGNPSNEEILKSFIIPTNHLAGNGVSPKLKKQNYDQEWRKYNQLLHRDSFQLTKQFNSHVNENGELKDYENSRMISTSKDPKQAEIFSKFPFEKIKAITKKGEKFVIEPNNIAHSNFVYKIKERKVGVIDTLRSPLKSKFAREEELTFYLGIDPEALQNVSIIDYDKNEVLLGSRRFERLNRLQIKMISFDKDNVLKSEIIFHLDPIKGTFREEVIRRDGKFLTKTKDVDLTNCQTHEFQYSDFFMGGIVDRVADFIHSEDKIKDEHKLTLSPKQGAILEKLKAKGYKVNDYLYNGVMKLQSDIHFDVINLLCDAGYIIEFDKILKFSHKQQLETLKLFISNGYYDGDKKFYDGKAIFFEISKVLPVITDLQVEAIKLFIEAKIEVSCEHIANSMNNSNQIEALKMINSKKIKDGQRKILFEGFDTISTEDHLSALKTLLDFDYPVEFKKIGKIKDVHQLQALKLLAVYGYSDDEKRQYLNLDNLFGINNNNQVLSINALLQSGFNANLISISKYVSTPAHLEIVKLMVSGGVEKAFSKNLNFEGIDQIHTPIHFDLIKALVENGYLVDLKQVGKLSNKYQLEALYWVIKKGIDSGRKGYYLLNELLPIESSKQFEMFKNIYKTK